MVEISSLLIIGLSLLIIYLMYQFLDKRGLYFTSIILSLVTFIFCFKITTIFKMNINSSILTIIELLTIIYIFAIKYDEKSIKNLIKLTFIANIIMTIMIGIMIFFIPIITETISINMQNSFEYNYKILVIYPFIILLSQYLVSKFYILMSKIQANTILNIFITYIITAILYTVIFLTISYIDIFELKDSLFLGISTYITGLAITILNIPYIYYLFSKKVIK